MINMCQCSVNIHAYIYVWVPLTDLSKKFIEVGDVGSGHRWAVAEVPFATPTTLSLGALPLGFGGLWAVKSAFAWQLLRAIIIKAKPIISPSAVYQIHSSAFEVIVSIFCSCSISSLGPVRWYQRYHQSTEKGKGQRFSGGQHGNSTGLLFSWCII